MITQSYKMSSVSKCLLHVQAVNWSWISGFLAAHLALTLLRIRINALRWAQDSCLAIFFTGSLHSSTCVFSVVLHGLWKVPHCHLYVSQLCCSPFKSFLCVSKHTFKAQFTFLLSRHIPNHWSCSKNRKGKTEFAVP